MDLHHHIFVICTLIFLALTAPYRYAIHGATLWLSSERCLFWEEERVLVLSDLHLGKTGHFRKAGIAIPQAVFLEDMQRLVSLIQFFQPTTLLIVGDLFHSRDNQELELFRKWRADMPALAIELVKGNHDILHRSWYEAAGIQVHPDQHTIGPFCFQHDPGSCSGDEDRYVISGHLHPGVVLKGLGKQSLSFPCFHFGPGKAILPAFGRFTGLAIVRPGEQDDVFAVVGQALIPLKKTQVADRP